MSEDEIRKDERALLYQLQVRCPEKSQARVILSREFDEGYKAGVRDEVDCKNRFPKEHKRNTIKEYMKIGNTRDKNLIGLFVKTSKEAAKRIDRNTVLMIIKRYGKNFVRELLK